MAIAVLLKAQRTGEDSWLHPRRMEDTTLTDCNEWEGTGGEIPPGTSKNNALLNYTPPPNRKRTFNHGTRPLRAGVPVVSSVRFPTKLPPPPRPKKNLEAWNPSLMSRCACGAVGCLSDSRRNYPPPPGPKKRTLEHGGTCSLPAVVPVVWLLVSPVPDETTPPPGPKKRTFCSMAKRVPYLPLCLWCGRSSVRFPPTSWRNDCESSLLGRPSWRSCSS